MPAVAPNFNFGVYGGMSVRSANVAIVEFHAGWSCKIKEEVCFISSQELPARKRTGVVLELRPVVYGEVGKHLRSFARRVEWPQDDDD